MKNYFLYIIAFILGGTLFYSLNNWYIIKSEKVQNVYSERALNKIHTTLQSQRYLLKDDDSYFDDDVLKNNTRLEKQLQALKTTLDKKFTIIEQIMLNLVEHRQDIEDYISTQAIFHNSLFFLMEYSVKSKSELSDQIKQTLYQYYHGRLNLEIKKDSLSKKKSIEEFLVKRHLYIFSKKYKFIKQLKEKIKHNKLLFSIEELQNILHTRYNSLQHQEDEFLTYIVITALSLFLLIAFLFIQLNRNINALKFSNEDMKRVYSAFENFTIFSRGDLRGNIIDANSKFCELSGYSREELLSKNFNTLRSGLMGNNFYRKLWNTLNAQKPFHEIVTNKNKEGELFFVDTIIVPILNNDGSTREYINIQHNITELIEARDQAHASLKAKDAFMSNMSHELRTPLNSIIGFSTILEKKIEDEKLKSYNERVLDSSYSLLELINNILDLSKINSNHFELDPYDFNLNDELQTLLDNLSVQIKNKKLHLHLDLKYENGVTLRADFKRIAQIINNLFSNAIKFTQEEKNIYFCVALEDSTLRFELKDEGIGMNEDTQKRVFEAFEQADNSTTRKYGGTGLGLNITKSLVELMQGKIELHSKENEGTSFKIYIPVEIIETIKEVTSSNEDDEAEFEALNAHALIVEDNKTNQMLIKLLLDDMGMTYATANDGVEAVEMYEKESFDIVLMDENMPNMNGTEAMKIIKKRHEKSAPIIALTANAMSEDREKFLQAGFDNYLSKPIDDKELYDIIKGELKKGKGK